MTFRAAIVCSGLLIAGCPSERRLSFQHLSHAGGGLTCNTCHREVGSRTAPAAVSAVADNKCTGCHRLIHGGRKKKGKCGDCHGPTHEEVAVGAAREHLRFSHKSHLGRNRGQCFPCHSAVVRNVSTFGDLFPGHTQCFSCHQKQWAAMECRYCHQSLRDYPVKPLGGFAHVGNFLRTHGRIATGRGVMCSQCHTQPFCAACHDPKSTPLRASLRWPEAVDRAFIHRGDYAGRHAIEARSSGDLCVRCHTPTECHTCHERRAIAAGSDRNPHPAGWVSVTGGPNLHGPAARRNIVSCAGCHDRGAASNCVRCHRVGGVGGNPHPPGWRSRLSKTTAAVCRVCH